MLLSEGFCPWSGTRPHSLVAAKVRDYLADEVDYGYCSLYDALVRAAGGKPEVRPLEDIDKNGWRLIECQT